MKIFISHSTKDKDAAESFVETLRLHYLNWWYAPRSLGPGYFDKQIYEALEDCNWFIVLISQNALDSKWVRREVEIAMKSEHLVGKVIPIRIDQSDWKSLHDKIGRYEAFDFLKDQYQSWNRLLNDVFHIQPFHDEFYTVGDVKIQVYTFVGGDGTTTYKPGEIICNAPEHVFELPPEIAATYDDEIAKLEATAKEKGQKLFNNRQMRIIGANWGSPKQHEAGIDNRPLHLQLGWTYYYFTRLTNMQPSRIMKNGRSLTQVYDPQIEALDLSRLSNPFATNLSVVTADDYIYYGFRGAKVAWNPSTLQPAVSGDGQPEDLRKDGTYDPFHTAIREGMEECTGTYRANPEDVTFFGLARTMKTRFPFLFGEIRLPITSRQLDSFSPLNKFEGIRQKIPFTVESVCDFVKQKYQDQIQGRLSGAVGTTIFSLLQSLHYRFSNEWLEVIDRLSFLEENKDEANCDLEDSRGGT